MGLKQQPKCKDKSCQFCNGKYCTILKSKPEVCRFYKAKAEAEAYKEFAEKIKKSIKENVDEAWHRDDGNGIYDAEYVLDDIDNLLKEMVGEKE